MRIALSHKFVVRSLLVAAAGVVFPLLVRATGVAVAPWASAFVALGVGGALGFFLSRELGAKFSIDKFARAVGSSLLPETTSGAYRGPRKPGPPVWTIRRPDD